MAPTRVGTRLAHCRMPSWPSRLSLIAQIGQSFAIVLVAVVRVSTRQLVGKAKNVRCQPASALTDGYEASPVGCLAVGHVRPGKALVRSLSFSFQHQRAGIAGQPRRS